MAERIKPHGDDALYRKIVRKTWRRKRFRDLPDLDKLILLYLWTSPESANPGIYYISIVTVADDLRNDSRMIRESFERLIRRGWFMYDFDERVIFFPKWADYDPPHNKNVVISYAKRVNDLPITKLTSYYLWTLKPFLECYGIVLENLTGIIPESFTQTFATQEQEQEHEQEQEQEQGAAEKFDQAKQDPAPSAPPVSDNGSKPTPSPDEMRAKILETFGGSAKKTTFGDYLLAVNQWLMAVYRNSQRDLRDIAGKIVKTVALNAYRVITPVSGQWPEPDVFVRFLHAAIGQPLEQGGLADGRNYPPRPEDMIRFVNQVFTNPQEAAEYAHQARQESELAR